MGRTIQLALLQMDVVIGEPESNFQRAKEMLEEAVKGTQKPDVILMPEMWNTGYALEQIDALADTKGSHTTKLVSEFCRKYEVNVIAGSVSDKSDESDEVKNTIYVFDREGHEVADYSKIHLFRLMEEEKFLTAGDRVGIAQLEESKIGLAICYDIRFPELARKIALNGAKVLFLPAEWPHPRLHHWRTLIQARAIENQMFVVASNRVGVSRGTEFFGHSMIVSPWGEVLAEGEEDETILTAEIDLTEVERVRRTIPVFQDRRPELY